ncbi:MAG: bifunctional folylpolyglutamate synthase/dihydrofolate synthase, partial [Spirochaetales bacterium]|nr:bifunctional folylpolyglutamate synthase/dihydrofolate synthase [Spirochaetales bacterium]
MSLLFNTTDEAFNFIASFINFERSKKQTIRDYRLDRMRELLKHFDSPEKSFKTIHLAGSKGKGSTAMFLASALNTAGEKTGFYSSPHISDYRERISLGGSFFEDKIYTDTAAEIAHGIKSFILDDQT